MKTSSSYDAVIVGAGHNGLVAACYLAMAGLRVLILEKTSDLGGATRSRYVFPGVDARVSVYSYLISLLPRKILADLSISLDLRRRAIASYTPVERGGRYQGLLISNVSQAVTRRSFFDLTGDDREFTGYQKLDEKISLFARKVWPTLLSPLPSKYALRGRFQTAGERQIWDYMVEKPLAALIEDHLSDEVVRGAVFTDAKIGVLTHPDDPTLLQNRTFLYHVIGQGTGEWRVPVGGMGALVDALTTKARALGVTFSTSSEVVHVDPGLPSSSVYYLNAGKESSVSGRYILFNTSSDITNRCLPGAFVEEQVEGAVFKINMVLNRLPQMKDPRVSAREAFTGTFHINEGYEQLKVSFHNAIGGGPSEGLPGEMYCHSLTDPSILSVDLQEKGYQTLTLFGLDVPYRWFGRDPEQVKTNILNQYVQSINRWIDGDLMDYLAVDENGNPCIEAKSPLDLENSLGLPMGNIFHGNLSWPFAEQDVEAGTWGVETAYENVLICGSSARRGGAVSGIPGHNAAMKILGSH